MNCPQCGAKVAEGEAICPKCDFILDASFLGNDAPPEGDDEPTGAGQGQSDRTNIGAAPKAPPKPAARPATKPPTGARPAVKKVATGTNKPVARAQTVTERPPRVEEPDEDVSTNVGKPGSRRDDDDDSTRPPAPGPARTGTSSGMQMVAPDQALDEFKYFVTGLPLGDKVAFVGAALTILSTFLPWKETAADGEILGLMSLGVVVFLVMAAVIAAIVIRVRRVMPQLNPLLPYLAQMGGTVFSGLWCIIYIGLAIDSRKVQALEGNFQVSVSSPSFGVFLALLLCGLTAAGTLMGLKARPQ